MNYIFRLLIRNTSTIAAFLASPLIFEQSESFLEGDFWEHLKSLKNYLFLVLDAGWDDVPGVSAEVSAALPSS